MVLAGSLAGDNLRRRRRRSSLVLPWWICSVVALLLSAGSRAALAIRAEGFSRCSSCRAEGLRRYRCFGDAGDCAQTGGEAAEGGGRREAELARQVAA